MASTKKELVVNGIKIPVIFEEQKSLPILNIQFIFKNSGFIKDENKQGLAYLSSKILNEGSSNLKATKFAEKLDENAITLYSSIGFETLILELSSLNEKRDIAINMFQKLIKSPNFSEDALKKVKTLAIGNLKRKENDFDDMASKGLNALLYKNTPLANPASGTVESISNINLKDIENFIKNAFTLNNLTIVAGGDISFEELKDILTPILTSLNIGKIEKDKRIDFTSKKDLKIIKKDTEQAYIYFGSSFNAQKREEDNYKAKVASFILGGSGFGSRLMEEIRVKRGLAYSAYASININKSYSSFTGYLQTKNESSDEAKELVISLVEEFVKNGVTKEELEAAKNFLSGSEPLRTETLAQRLNRAFILDFKGLAQDYPKNELEKIQNLKLEDLNNYIKTHTELNNLTFFIVRN
ncbi:M16 family metallopeptidase [Aliarcobacter thereius]|uniref:Peptidase M16 inactive domain protein n=1 Tax=Aliarcobacter thereius LMG 24486 TaxID=1032240 RepID=A0A1C7WQI7_9BACT|nr:pitrilysin family protein [Aliarcobacter thereius]OCL91126.1 Peptidase M16 inactive domain protein [Aliarcobacter thereius]OCL96021.1 Peptidase M16 inactive domain protein [Aliarcobacter thereius LMG 24486]QBF16007.1 zinc-dependent peptidase, M16 family [Aliarcobacter thereius LMG 24486]TLS94650.1 insulinase family protein [Aliarcobacter thereius]HJE02886.1 insulinase family protein [Aliarcobacter thereius]